MARKPGENLSFQDRLKAWWETDTAKAIATIVAVLLIPASVIAWNYATNQGKEITNQLKTDSTTADVSEDENIIDEESALDSEESDTTGAETAQGTTGQEPATDTATDQNQPAVGGLGSVEKLPNTSSETITNYTVKNGDSVYRISINICGNDSFYISSMRKNYLKVGETIRVKCTY